MTDNGLVLDNTVHLSHLDQAHNPHSQQVAAMLLDFSMIYLLRHFRQRWWLCHMKTWYPERQGIIMRSICDYILGIDWRHFEMVKIRSVRNYPSDHFALQARLQICPLEAGHH